MKMCFLGEIAVKTNVNVCEAFKKDPFGKTQVYKWYLYFKRSEISFKGSSPPGRSEMMKILKTFTI